MKYKFVKGSSKIIAIILIMSLFSITVLATTYSSSISIDYRSTMTGSGRSYVGTTHKIANTLSTRFYNTGDNYCDFQLQKQSGTSYSTTGTQTLDLRTIGSTYTATYSNQATSGTFRYFLTNRYLSNDYRYTLVDGFGCNQVSMSSN